MPLDDLRELPAQVHRVLHADVEALPTRGRCTCAASPASSTRPLAVGRRLPGHVGEAGDPRRAVDSEVGAVDGDERLAEIGQRGLAGGLDLLARSP